MYKILKLISQLPEIKKSFRVSGGVGVPKLNVIYNTEDFVSWKESMKYDLVSNIFKQKLKLQRKIVRTAKKRAFF